MFVYMCKYNAMSLRELLEGYIKKKECNDKSLSLMTANKETEYKERAYYYYKILMKRSLGICRMNSGLIKTVRIKPFLSARFAVEVCCCCNL